MEGQELDHPFTDHDLLSSIRQLKNGRSAKPNGVPGEVWKLLRDSPELRWDLLNFLNKCLQEGRLPSSWSKGEVVGLYKKSDPTLPINYRPITLLDTLYKVFICYFCPVVVQGV